MAKFKMYSYGLIFDIINDDHIRNHEYFLYEDVPYDLSGYVTANAIRTYDYTGCDFRISKNVSS